MQATRALNHLGNWLHTMDIRNDNAIILVIIVDSALFALFVDSPTRFPSRSMSPTMAIVVKIGLATNIYPMPIFIIVDCPVPSSLTNRLAKTNAQVIIKIGTLVNILNVFNRYRLHKVSLHFN